jgi:hypothetical protein
MNRSATEAFGEVPPEEVQRRIAEYRRIGFERHLPAIVVYQDPNTACPWPDCDLRIAGIAFRLDRMGDHALYYRLLVAWWQGPGLVGRCPRCHRNILFDLSGKKTVTDLGPYESALLPEDWDQKAHLVIRPG